MCHGCKQEFTSHNAVFKHLIDTDAAFVFQRMIMTIFCHYVVDKQEEQVLLLFGYLIEQFICEIIRSSEQRTLRESE